MLVAIVGLAVAATLTIEQQQREDLLRTVDTDMAGLADVMVQGGTDELVKRIADRTQLESQSAPAAFYLLTDATGQRLAGNMNAPPSLDSAHSESAIVLAPDGPVVARATRLRGGFRRLDSPK